MSIVWYLDFGIWDFMNKNFFLTTGILAGTIIGAGIFALPYVFSRLGFIAGFFYLIVFALVYFAIHLMYAEVVQTKDGEHQFFYFAEKYLPKGFGGLATLIILGELVFVLTVYLILAPVFAGLIFGSGGLTALIIFWFLGSIFMFVRLSWIGMAELFGTLSIFAIVATIFILGLSKPLETPAFREINWPVLFLPFGPLLFSLAGRPAIPKVVEEYRKIQKGAKSFSLRKVMFWGTTIPALVYFVFVIGILRLNPNASPESLNSLGFLSPQILALLGILGLITLWTSYFIIGINVKDILRIDLKYPVWLAAGVALFAPLILYFLGFQNFLEVITFTGSVFLALEGIFVIAMWRKAFPTSSWRWISLPLYLIFVVALGYEIASFII